MNVTANIISHFSFNFGNFHFLKISNSSGANSDSLLGILSWERRDSYSCFLSQRWTCSARFCSFRGFPVFSFINFFTEGFFSLEVRGFFNFSLSHNCNKIYLQIQQKFILQGSSLIFVLIFQDCLQVQNISSCSTHFFQGFVSGQSLIFSLSGLNFLYFQYFLLLFLTLAD